MAKKKKGLVFRFAVGTPDGVHSNVWRLWAEGIHRGKSDVYLAVRAVAGEFKWSFHTGGDCYEAITSEQAPNHPQLKGRSRVQAKWRRPVGAPHVQDALRILVPGSALRVTTVDTDTSGDVHWLPTLAPGWCTFICIGFVDSESPFYSAGAAQSLPSHLASWPLPNGEHLVLRALHERNTANMVANCRKAAEGMRSAVAGALASQQSRWGEPVPLGGRGVTATYAYDGPRVVYDLPIPFPEGC